MKVSFDRRAHEGESRVLTSFEKKVEIPEESSLQDVVDQYAYHYLAVLDLPVKARSWRLIAIRGTQYCELAQIREGELAWLNDRAETIRQFFDGETGAILGIPDATAEDRTIPSNWQKVPLPILIDTRSTQYLALVFAVVAIAAFSIMLGHYERNKVILAEALVTSILCALGCYFALLKGRRISFQEHIVIYRNRFNRYERFTPEQFDHMEWFAPGRDIKFVFQYEEKARNFISAPLDRELELVIWAKSQRIPLYSSHP